MSWWETASVEQRLAQIDGGIECGMTSRQVGLAIGAKNPNAVGPFAAYYGRHFSQRRKPAPVTALKRAYWNGDRDIGDNRAPAVSVRVLDDDFEELAL